MNRNDSERHAVWAPLFFSLVMVVGMVLGFNLRDSLRNKRDVITVLQRNDRLEEIIDLVNEKYVDTVSGNAMYQNAVGGILRNLDPHTIYIPPDDVEGENDDLEGTFSGIGVEFAIVRDTIQVTAVIEGGPASNAGVIVGAQMIRVGDSLVAGRHITTDQIVHLLRGKQKTRVLVTFRDPVRAELQQVPITRGVIAINSVEANIMLDRTTGYIKINKFGGKTTSEFKKALKALLDQGAQQMVVDLRDNPGGYLEAATSIADEFLNDKKLIVYTRGLHSARTDYRAGEPGKFETGRLVILIDERSASASEILAGAVQDWDRGLIVGRRSFGKGLVQEQYALADGGGLRLTIAKYYTPSGRCIQRSFANGRSAYQEDFENRYRSGELTGKPDEFKSDTLPFYTASKRVVFGGGGIKPDIYVPYDTTKTSAALSALVYSQETKTATWDYFMQHRREMNFKNTDDFQQRFHGEEAMFRQFVRLIKPKDQPSVWKLLRSREHMGYFKTQLKAQIARLIFHDNGYYAVMLTEDEMVRKSLEVLKNGTYESLLKESVVAPKKKAALEASLLQKDQKRRHKRSDDRW